MTKIFVGVFFFVFLFFAFNGVFSFMQSTFQKMNHTMQQVNALSADDF